MKSKKSVFYAGAMALMLVSCADESPWGDSGNKGTGSLKVLLSTSEEVSGKIPNVRSVSGTIVTPEVEKFQLRMTSKTGNFEKTWSSVAEFEKEKTFPIGTYDLEAYYNTPSSQGVVAEGEKGHEHAYYYGVCESLKIEAGKTTTIQVQTALANAVVVIEYTDAFTNYFSDWSTTLNTKGEAPLNLGNHEGMSYVVPGDVDVIISATQQNGKTVRVNPAVFEAEPQHLYKIRYNIYNGEIGEVDKIEITFDDGVDGTLPILIDLTDELLSEDGPEISTNGFVSETPVETLYGSKYEGDLSFNVSALNGFTEALLTINSENYNPDFLTDGRIDLCNISEDTKAKLEKAGIRALGFEANTSKMALLNLSDLVGNLPSGNHSISLVVKDRAQRTSETAVLKISSIPVELEVIPNKAIFGEGYAEISLWYNGADPTKPGNNPFSFKVTGDGTPQDVEILSINGIDTRAFEKKEYLYKISLPLAFRDEYPVEIYFNNGENVYKTSTIELEYPEYKVEYDAMAKRVRLRIADMDNDPRKELFNSRLRIFVDGQEMKEDRLIQDPATNVFTITGFDSCKAVPEIKTSMEAKETPEVYYGINSSLITESENQIPNGDFSETRNTININPINIGFLYEVTVNLGILGKYTDDYQNISSIVRNEAVNWASLNAKTCSENVKTLNTWYSVPSAFVDNDIYTIRTVGYSHTGEFLPKSGGNMNRNYYCETVPEKSALTICAGELFLGSYSYNGGDNRVEGVSFDSRPSKFSFKYNSMSLSDSENAGVSILLKDKEGKVLSQAHQSLKNTFTWNVNESTLLAPSENVTLNLPEYPFGAKVSSIEVKFLSSTSVNPDIYIPNGSQLNEGVGNIRSDSDKTISANGYHAYAKGSVLKISDLKLIYE